MECPNIQMKIVNGSRGKDADCYVSVILGGRLHVSGLYCLGNMKSNSSEQQLRTRYRRGVLAHSLRRLRLSSSHCHDADVGECIGDFASTVYRKRLIEGKSNSPSNLLKAAHCPDYYQGIRSKR